MRWIAGGHRVVTKNYKNKTNKIKQETPFLRNVHIHSKDQQCKRSYKGSIKGRPTELDKICIDWLAVQAPLQMVLSMTLNTFNSDLVHEAIHLMTNTNS